MTNRIDTQAIRQQLREDGHDWTPGDGSLVDMLHTLLAALDAGDAERAMVEAGQ